MPTKGGGQKRKVVVSHIMKFLHAKTVSSVVVNHPLACLTVDTWLVGTSP